MFNIFSETHIVHSTEKAEEKTTTTETKAEDVDHIDAEALPLATSNTGNVVGMVMGGILAAVVVTALVGYGFSLFFLIFHLLSVSGYICAPPQAAYQEADHSEVQQPSFSPDTAFR